MLSFVLRRLVVSALLLLGATFIMYLLVAASGDPLEGLRESSDPNREALIQNRISALDLNTPVPLRYFLWLAGAAQCLVPFVGQCDLGVNIRNQAVTDLLPIAMQATVQLLAAATLLAIVFGVLIGVVTAIRQNSGLDVSTTFFVFLAFSLPAFVIAVLLKEFLAIGFNDFLADPVIPGWVTVGLALVAGVVWQAVIAGETRRRVIAFVAAALVTAAIVVYIDLTDWFRFPGIGPVATPLIALGVGVGIAALLSGLSDRRGLLSGVVSGGLVAVAYFVLQPLFDISTWGTIVIVWASAVAAGCVVGFVVGGFDRARNVRIGGITAFLAMAVVVLDRFMQSWDSYVTNRAIGGRPIATVGSETPTLSGDIWIHGIDSYTHFLLPTVSLVLISLASYTRYVRAGMLEVLNQDYIRTARAKGLNERVVVVRHAFRNSLIPLATFIPVDIASVVGGAIITEQVFSINGMGQLFIRGLNEVDPNPVMGYFIVVAAFVLIANLVADLSYALLDPRVRITQ